jgi:hypothetical protein
MDESKSNSEMDQAAEHAKRELLAQFRQRDVVALGHWWTKWYLSLGHDRLGKMLVDIAERLPPVLPARKHIAELPDIAGVKSVPEPTASAEKIASATSLIERAEKTVLNEIKLRRVQDEEPITDRLIGAITQLFNDHVHEGVRWSAKTLTSHKRNAEETRFGADLLGVLNVDLKDYSVHKGFLVQAKYLRHSETIGTSEFDRLKEQCRKMLNNTGAAYVFLYRSRGITVLPALAVTSLSDPQKFATLKRLRLTQFFKDHFNCFVGDQTLNSSTDDALKTLRDRVDARDAMLLSAKPAE